MLKQPQHKYRPFPKVALTDRTDANIVQASLGAIVSALERAGVLDRASRDAITSA